MALLTNRLETMTEAEPVLWVVVVLWHPAPTDSVFILVAESIWWKPVDVVSCPFCAFWSPGTWDTYVLTCKTKKFCFELCGVDVACSFPHAWAGHRIMTEAFIRVKRPTAEKQAPDACMLLFPQSPAPSLHGNAEVSSL